MDQNINIQTKTLYVLYLIYCWVDNAYFIFDFISFSHLKMFINKVFKNNLDDIFRKMGQICGRSCYLFYIQLMIMIFYWEVVILMQESGKNLTFSRDRADISEVSFRHSHKQTWRSFY